MDVRGNREFLKDSIRLEIDFSATDQSRGVPTPPIEKPVPPGVTPLPLAEPTSLSFGKNLNLASAFAGRRSHRRFSRESLSPEELSFLLWATQGIRDPGRKQPMLRTVPSAGARHALETYVAVLRVNGMDSGLYRYLPSAHSLVPEYTASDLGKRLTKACLGQTFVGEAAAVFIWATIPYRMEWRYGLAAHRVIPMDAGHVCQNLYLACQAISAGTCAVAAYHQQLMDQLLRIDGDEEFTLYLAPVGKVELPRP